MEKIHVNHKHQPRYSVQQTIFNTSVNTDYRQYVIIFEVKPNTRPDFKFGVLAGVGVVTTPTPDFNTELEITHCVSVCANTVYVNL